MTQIPSRTDTADSINNVIDSYQKFCESLPYKYRTWNKYQMAEYERKLRNTKAILTIYEMTDNEINFTLRHADQRANAAFAKALEDKKWQFKTGLSILNHFCSHVEETLYEREDNSFDEILSGEILPLFSEDDSLYVLVKETAQVGACDWIEDILCRSCEGCGEVYPMESEDNLCEKCRKMTEYFNHYTYNKIMEEKKENKAKEEKADKGFSINHEQNYGKK